MTITTLSSRELNHDITKAKKASRMGPVFITERGKLAHVLLSFEEYRKIIQQRRSIAETLALPEASEIEFNPPHAHIVIQPVDFK